MSNERIRLLMMAHLDGEISGDEARELEDALRVSPELRAELARHEALHRRLRAYRLRDPADEVLEELDRGLLRRAGLPLGWLLFLAGLLVVTGWALLSWFGDAGAHLGLRLAAGAVMLGMLLLLLVKIRERWIEYRNDPYRDVIR